MLLSKCLYPKNGKPLVLFFRAMDWLGWLQDFAGTIGWYLLPPRFLIGPYKVPSTTWREPFCQVFCCCRHSWRYAGCFCQCATLAKSQRTLLLIIALLSCFWIFVHAFCIIFSFHKLPPGSPLALRPCLIWCVCSITP